MSKNLKGLLLICIAQIIIVLHLTAQTPEYLEKRADAYLKNKLYALSKDIYRELPAERLQDPSFLLKRAIAEFESNQIDTAENLIGKIFDLKKTVPDLAYYVKGRIRMAHNQFEEAANVFKSGLASISTSSRLRPKLIDEIKRCGVGNSLLNAPEISLVESVGDIVNSSWDEIHPLYSINFDLKFYFSSNRQAIESFNGDATDYEAPFDIYSSSLDNGEWGEINPINDHINTKQHDVLLAFDDGGQILYLKSGSKLNELSFKTDTFSDAAGISKSGSIDIPGLMSSDQISFFNDSFVLIASNREGGLGGYDLYYTQKVNGIWSKWINFGDEINSPYDEMSPYLAYDGRTLLFSSNNTHSMGGFDIFISKYSDKLLTWEQPANLGFPINSSADELYFRLNKTRMGGIFSSNRKSGVGGFDIYVAYFKNIWVPQKERSNPVVFADILNKKSITPVVLAQNTVNVIELENEDIFYTSAEQLKLPAIQNQLQQIKKILELNPNLSLIIETFIDKKPATTSQAFLQSFQIAEEVKKILSTLGIKSSRLVVRAYGTEFPVAKEIINGENNPAGSSLNKRIEFTFYAPDVKINDYIKLIKAPLQVNELMASSEYADFRAAESSLNYKLLFVSLANLSNLEAYVKKDSPEFFIERSNSTGKYELLSKGYADYTTANLEKKKWKTNQFEDILVVPFYKNQRILTPLLKSWAEKFPDLNNYIYRGE